MQKVLEVKGHRRKRASTQRAIDVKGHRCKKLYRNSALIYFMTDQSTSPKDFERVLGKAAVEAARTASQASQAAKRIFSEMASESSEAKGYDTPDIDLIDTNDEIIALIALPGVSKDRIDLRTTEDLLSIEAQAMPREGKYLRRDMSPNGFKREIKLPAEIKPEAVRASYQNGILEVHLPKLVVVNAQRVQVE